MMAVARELRNGAPRATEIRMEAADPSPVWPGSPLTWASIHLRVYWLLWPLATAQMLGGGT